MVRPHKKKISPSLESPNYITNVAPWFCEDWFSILLVINPATLSQSHILHLVYGSILTEDQSKG